MTNLEQRMLEAIRLNGSNGTRKDFAKSCTKIAIEEIRKAFEAGMEYEATAMTDIDNYLSDNNLISKE